MPDNLLIDKIVTIPEALITKVIHSSDENFIYEGGVLDSTKVACKESLLKRGYQVVQKCNYETRDYKPDYLKGNWIYGGIFNGHFGHFVTETMSRMWALNQVEKYDGVIFSNVSGSGSLSNKPKWVLELFELYGLPTEKIKLFESDTIVESLICPTQGMILQIGATEKQRTYLSSMFKKNVVQSQVEHYSDKVYVSRSKYSKGMVAGEEVLERELEKNGFFIFHPQNHSIIEQLLTYKNADILIGLTGSAFHTLLLLDSFDGKLIEISRRGEKNVTQHVINKSMGIDSKVISFVKQASKFGAKATTIIDLKLILQELIQSNIIKEANLSNICLDFSEEYELLIFFEKLKDIVVKTKRNDLSKYINDEDVKLLKRLTMVKPNFAEGFYYLAQIEFSKADYINAELNCCKATELENKTQRYFNFLAIIFHRQNKYDQALEAINKAIEIEENYNNLHLKGIIEFKMHKYQDSLQSIDRCLLIHSTFLPALDLREKLSNFIN